MLQLIFPPALIALFLVLLCGTKSSCGEWIIKAAQSFTHFKSLLIVTAVLALPVVYRIEFNSFRSIDGTLHDMMRVYGVTKLSTAQSNTRGVALWAMACGFVRALAELAILLPFIKSLTFDYSLGSRNLLVSFAFICSILVTIVTVVALLYSPRRCRR